MILKFDQDFYITALISISSIKTSYWFSDLDLPVSKIDKFIITEF